MDILHILYIEKYNQFIYVMMQIQLIWQLNNDNNTNIIPHIMFILHILHIEIK